MSIIKRARIKTKEDHPHIQAGLLLLLFFYCEFVMLIKFVFVGSIIAEHLQNRASLVDFTCQWHPLTKFLSFTVTQTIKLSFNYFLP